MRLLLAIIALLTGLAVQVSPAHARLRNAGGSEIGMTVAKVSFRSAAVSFPLQWTQFRGDPVDPRICASFLPDLRLDCAPAVRAGIDRARE